jgi:hypothetical protein
VITHCTRRIPNVRERQPQTGRRGGERDLAKLLLVGGEVGGELIDAQVAAAAHDFTKLLLFCHLSFRKNTTVQ